MIRLLVLLAALGAGCSGASEAPGLTTRRQALDAWERGRTALEAGQAEPARVAFEEALDRRPADPLLLAWRAQAEAGIGDLDAAIATLGVVLSREPGMAAARYNLACYQVRRGDLDAAAESLQHALADGAADPREVLDDPDFQPHLAHPAFAFLPAAAVDVSVVGPAGTVFLGSDAAVQLTVRARNIDSVTVTAPPVEGPVELAKVDERDQRTKGEDHTRTVSWYLRIGGAGAFRAGPFEVVVDGRTVKADAVEFVGLAPPGHRPPKPRTVTLELPSAVAQTKGTEPSAWTSSGRLVVRAGPHDRVVIDGNETPATRWQYFDGRVLSWVLHTTPAPSKPTRVRVVRGGDTVYDGVVGP